MDRHFEHALVLLEQGRYDLAENKLRMALMAEPNDALAHALLAECLCQDEQLTEATSEAKQAIHLDPDLPQGHAALARALHLRNYLKEAEQATWEAIRLNPTSADHFNQLAAIHMSHRNWNAALEAAETGLANDPEHVGCINIRGMALVKLGRNAEAGHAIDSALRRAPEDAFSHANQGWTLLYDGQRTKALEHFREALRLEPGMEFAKSGIVEAMKSKNWLYAIMLRYFLWMDRLSGKAQWAVILGAYFGYRALGMLADKNPTLAPWIKPILLLYMVFAVMTWISSPLFNLMLRLDRFGRHALSRDQIIASNVVFCFVAPALILGVIWLATDNSLAMLGALYFGLLLLPVSAIFNCQWSWPRIMMILYTSALACTGVAWLPVGVITGNHELALDCLQVFLWGCFLSGFVANFLIMQRPRR